MTDHQVVFRNEYLSNIQSVIDFGRQLSRHLDDSDARTREYAIELLDSAAQSHQTRGDQYRGFMFTESGILPRAEPGKEDQTLENALATVMVDLDMSAMLMSAAQSVGEVGTDKPSLSLEQMVSNLETSTQTAEDLLRRPDGGDAERLAFDETPRPVTATSANLDSAIQKFRNTAEETFKALLENSKDVLLSVIKALSKLKIDDLTNALSAIGAGIEALPKIGRLFRRGLEIFAEAINSLTSLLGHDLIQQVRQQIESIWEKLKTGAYAEAPIIWAFGVDVVRGEIDKILASDGLEVTTLDQASTELAQLAAGFERNTGLLKGIASAVALAGTFLFLIPTAGPQIALTAASIYVVILGALILIGRDYTDVGPLNRVQGVGQIAQGCLRSGLST